jgi:hypothetical protein
MAAATRPGKPRLARGRLAAALALLLPIGGDCTGVAPPPPPEVMPPRLEITLDGVPADMNGLLVVPPSGFVVNVSLTPGTLALDPSYFLVFVDRWGGEFNAPIAGIALAPDGRSAAGVASLEEFGPGTYTIHAAIADVGGNWGQATLAFAARPFRSAPPIGSGQKFWLDFASDRDAVPGPDFAADLEHFGLTTAANPSVAATAEARVIEAVLDRLAEIYHEADGNGLGAPDPVEVDFFAYDPGAGDVTRVCVGGEDPSGGWVIGNIQLDAGNARRGGAECATLPPTGIFPRELLWFTGQAAFQQAFDALRPETGGTPIGAHPLDRILLDPSFDPANAGPEPAARWQAIHGAIGSFAAALGTIVGHEIGHALGLVPAGPPGGGLFGGTSGALVTHDATPAGTSPPESFVMCAGNSYSFAKLAGLEGHPRPLMRALDYAYLRDRVVVDAKVTGLFMPPRVDSVSPASVAAGSVTQISVTGFELRATPWMRLENGALVAHLQGESFVSSTEVRGWVLASQAVPGTYDLVVENPDGQIARLPGAITIRP